MFEVRCIVKDNRLSDVLRALRAVTVEPPVVLPVDEPEVEEVQPERKTKKPRGFKRGRKPSVQAYDVLTDWLRTAPDVFPAHAMRKALEDKGIAGGSYWYPLGRLIQEGKVLKTEETGQYRKAA